MASIGGLNGDKGDSAMEVEEAATSGANAASKDDHEVAGEGGEINDDEAMEEEEEEEEEVDDDVEDNGDEEEDAHGKRPSEIVVRQKHCRFDQFQGTSRYKKYGSVIQSQDTGSVSKEPCKLYLKKRYLHPNVQEILLKKWLFDTEPKKWPNLGS